MNAPEAANQRHRETPANLACYDLGVRLVVKLPDHMLGVLGPDAASAAKKLRLLAAMKLYERGEVSSGFAAALAGLARVEFLATLGEYGVSPFQLSPADLERDLEAARGAAPER